MVTFSDHAGGNVELTKRFPGLRVYGFDERIPSLTNKVIDEEIIHIDDLDVKVIHTPCHTSGSVCFAVMNDDRHMAVFTGDTLFLGGCGRFFEGSAKEMVESLHVKLGQLPPEISIFPGHEYTLSNLKVSFDYLMYFFLSLHCMSNRKTRT